MGAESIFNYFVGGFALLSTIFSMLVYLHVYLPGPRMKAFDELLVETRNIYEKASADDLLPAEMSREAQAQLREYEIQGDDLRLITYRTLSPIEILVLLFRGHTTKIKDLSNDVVQLRGKLLTTSQRERARRMGQHYAGREPLRIDLISASQRDPNQHNPACSPSPEPTSRTDVTEIITTSTISSVTPTPPSDFCICTLLRRLSAMFPRRRTSPSPTEPPLSDIDRSRSSTLVGAPTIEDLCGRHPWSFSTRWARIVNAQPTGDDLEARLEVSNCSNIHNAWKTACEPSEMNSGTVSMSV